MKNAERVQRVAKKSRVSFTLKNTKQKLGENNARKGDFPFPFGKYLRRGKKIKKSESKRDAGRKGEVR